MSSVWGIPGRCFCFTVVYGPERVARPARAGRLKSPQGAARVATGLIPATPLHDAHPGGALFHGHASQPATPHSRNIAHLRLMASTARMAPGHSGPGKQSVEGGKAGFKASMGAGQTTGLRRQERCSAVFHAPQLPSGQGRCGCTQGLLMPKLGLSPWIRAKLLCLCHSFLFTSVQAYDTVHMWAIRGIWQWVLFAERL